MLLDLGDSFITDRQASPVMIKGNGRIISNTVFSRRSRTMDYVLETVWEEMDTPGSALVEAINFETHAALCKVYEQRETEKLRL